MSNKFNKLKKTVINNVKLEEYDDEKIVVEKAEDVLPQDLLEKVKNLPVFPNRCTSNAYSVSYHIPDVDFVECLFGVDFNSSLNPHCINRYNGHYFDVTLSDADPYFVKRVFKSKEIQKVYKPSLLKIAGKFVRIPNKKGAIVTFIPNKEGKVLSSKGCMVQSCYPEGFEEYEFYNRYGQFVRSVIKYVDRDEYNKMAA